ncbi:anthrone oxygenase family protein [Salinactinospora qingdaonensis]
MLRGGVLVIATLATALIAGLFYAFSVCVMPGLAAVDDRAFIDAMQQINIAVLNPWFLLPFCGAPLAILAAGALHLGPGRRRALVWIAAAFVCYVVAFMVTGTTNVPLNDALAAAGAPAELADPAAVRQRFEADWTMWNTVRAVAATAALGCLSWALVLSGRYAASQ